MSIFQQVLMDPLRNRGTAFTLAERSKLGLTGRLPAAVETLDQQAARAYAQLRSYPGSHPVWIPEAVLSTGPSCSPALPERSARSAPGRA